MSARVLVIGGAGYIGSICARVFSDAGHRIVTLDNLSTGHRGAVSGPFIEGDIRDRKLLQEVLRSEPFDAVLHFAAKSVVGHSVHQPAHYFDVNVGGTIGLVQEMLDAGVRRMVFSSTCAIYGTPLTLPLTEDLPFAPVSPYGETKAMVERFLALCREREGLQVTCLRYFNAAGAMLDGSLGEAHDPETHLIPLAIQAAMGRRPPLKLFGTDYPTRDGTCVRDYIHVLDLADAHLRALKQLLEGDSGDGYNVGTGQGTTVREVLAATGRAVGTPVPHAPAPRRAGDPAALYAQSDKARLTLGWEPRFTDLDDIVSSAVKWARSPQF
ncbi:MAG: UDP-glucose 4-epimerase GalE [Deltaproteobacteria bacterium]|nr:UDP-glucose 4-epimerase GalE [Deltaproteobacteria bacterium]HCH65876.1 UDP-glucose 4-epimerase GalE [Deltaproteobacteria bacterium]